MTTVDPAEARRQRDIVISLRRLEDEARRQRHTLDTILGTLELIRDRLDRGDEGGSGVREPREPRPESPGDAIALEGEDE